ncbi:hypothetical protein XM47_06810 [Catenovulum maritimum]|uniref:Sel1 repeat family protein n=1 Tax=Catenovulum maritimum TaxID=1513271 RepID=A0A0J8GSR7_9ALTE|nr:hypothetical protein XM47_06810 [Catenovulum maritimum]
MVIKDLTEQVSELTNQVNQLKNPTPSKSDSLKPSAQKMFATGVYYAKNKDYIHAAKWFRRSAMAGHGKAMFYLGMMFIKEQGLPQSLIHSYVWMSLAQVYDVSEAKAAKNEIQHKLTARELNLAQRLAADRYEDIEHELIKLR